MHKQRFLQSQKEFKPNENDCRNCADIDNCDKFYITEQHCISNSVGIDEATGRVIEKKFF